MTQRVLVTGATGTVGRRVVEHLARRGDSVRVTAGLHTAARAAQLPSGVASAVTDFGRQGSLEQAFAGQDTVFLLTPPSLSMDEDVVRALSAARAAGVSRIVRLSVMGAELEPGISLTRLHRSAELAVMGSELDWSILRPNAFMQNFMASAQSIREQGSIYTSLGDATVSYIDAEDIAACAAVIIADMSDQFSGAMLTITGPESLTMADVAARFCAVLGRPVRAEAVTDEQAAAAMSASGMPQQMVAALTELNAAMRDGYFASVTTEVENLTGRPARDFQQFAADNRAAFA